MPDNPATDSSQTAVGSATVASRTTSPADAALSPSDEALMAALQAGDDAALAQLMERWELGVKGFLLRLGVPLADIEDIAQETFVRLYSKRENFRSGARFKPWLLTIAGNLGRNRRRWWQRRREQSIDAAPDISPVSGATGSPQITLHTLPDSQAVPADQIAERNNTCLLVRQAVATLPDKLRGAIVCVDLEDLSHAEAAAVIGCTAKAVENRLHRARKLLRERCQHLLTIL